MDYLPVQNGSPNRDATTDRKNDRIRSAGFWHIPPVRRHLEALVKHAHDHSVICITQPRGPLCNSIEHRLELSWRTGDDSHFARGRLLLQGFREVPVADLQFLEQPNVLDSNDGLIGEGFEKGYLLISKGTGMRTGYPDGSNGVSVP